MVLGEDSGCELHISGGMMLERTAGPALHLRIYGYHQKSFIGYIFCISLEDPADFHKTFVLLLSVTNFIHVCTYT